jgi:hypothetical protein
MTAVARRGRGRLRGSFFGARLVIASTASAADHLTLPTPTREERAEYLRRSRVCEGSDVASKDLYNGPKGTLPFAPDQEIACEFGPKPLAGVTEKFLCRLDDGRVFKVKYDEGHKYKEVFGEILGTRLFWALGFYADRMLSVRVRCGNCPKHPWKYVRARKHRPPLDADGLLRRRSAPRTRRHEGRSRGR